MRVITVSLLLPVFLMASAVAGGVVDEVMGDWEGSLVVSGAEPSVIVAQVIALGHGKYRANLLLEFDKRVDALAVLEGEAREGAVVFGLGGRETKWSGAIQDGVFRGKLEGAREGSFELKAVTRLSPTLGQKPPDGAAILLDGVGADAWVHVGNGQPCKWKALEGGGLGVAPGTGSIISKPAFRDHRIHVEFRSPFMPEARGQKRGNSGVYVQGFYEVQVLDSYGLEGRDNECGGIYSVAAPRVNMCAPPMQWQTYDIDFKAPRFDESGNKIANARMTVAHNGVRIHDDLEVPRPTTAHAGGDIAKPGGLMLQDHGDLVQYRNIWVVEQ